MPFADYQSALTAWQNAVRQIRTLQSQLSAIETAIAARRGQQAQLLDQVAMLEQQRDAAHDAMEQLA